VIFCLGTFVKLGVYVLKNFHEDTEGLRSLLSFIEKKVAKKATTASDAKAALTCYLLFSVLQNSLKLAPSKFLNVQTVSDGLRKEEINTRLLQMLLVVKLSKIKLSTPKEY